MLTRSDFYIDGEWVAPFRLNAIEVVNPATEQSVGSISLGSDIDVDRAVAAARKAFNTYSLISAAERVALLQRIVEVYRQRLPNLAKIISSEMGAPISFATDIQAALGLAHFEQAILTLQNYRFERPLGTAVVTREPIGVCGLITAWNWPINLIASKLAYALAAGCTVVLKPSEIAPLSAMALAEVLHDAGVPAGVFNLVNGDGPTVGQRISSHPDIDMVSFTGSTRAGILIAKSAAETVKRVHQELGGKSANIILPDADLAKAVDGGVRRAFSNAGQSCQAPTRMFVHESQYRDAVALAKNTAMAIRHGDPALPETEMGPVVSQLQFDRIQGMIQTGIAEGANLVCGGLGKPEGLSRGYYVRPTIFSEVRNDMRIAQEEIFGPVLPILSYQSEGEAIELANDTVYGLASYIQTGDLAKARRIAGRLRSGRVYINSLNQDIVAPFGGYKQSGNGREQGEIGFEEYLEIKAIIT